MPRSSIHHKFHTVSICALLLLCYTAHVQADCHVAKDGLEYDLAGMDGEHTVYRTRETPPTIMKDVLTFNPCGPLPRQEVADHDQVRLRPSLHITLSKYYIVSTRDCCMSYNSQHQKY